MIKKIKNLKGFTLLELMVSVAIIAIISTIFLSDYRTGGRKADLSMAAQKLASDIRIAQSDVLSLKEYNGTNSVAWGIRLEESADNYLSFADVVVDGKYRLASSELHRTFNFPKGITMTDFDIDGVTNRSFLYLVFDPPDPKVLLGAASDGANGVLQEQDKNFVKITLSDDIGNEIYVSVNRFGLIDIEK